METNLLKARSTCFQKEQTRELIRIGSPCLVSNNVCAVSMCCGLKTFFPDLQAVGAVGSSTSSHRVILTPPADRYLQLCNPLRFGVFRDLNRISINRI